MSSTKEKLLSWLIFFLSMNTLLCCTLPTILVALGFGYLLVNASAMAELSWFLKMAHHNFLIFLVTGVLLVISNWLLYRPSKYCPESGKAQCQQLTGTTYILINISACLWLISFLFAYFALPIQLLFESW